MSAVLEFSRDDLAQRKRSMLARMTALLGLRSPLKSEDMLVDVARQRLAPRAIRHLAAAGLRARHLSFIIPARTLSHRNSKGERLTVEESDRALRLARIVALADIVFGDHGKALRWLDSSKKQFGGASALDMTGTETGARLVEELLVRIDEGYFA